MSPRVRGVQSASSKSRQESGSQVRSLRDANQSNEMQDARELVARDAGRRELTEPKEMRALAHPTRLAILEALVREGPLTATQAANLLGDSPGNISWHLQTLARYGFIEETGTGRGRTRPWRLVSLGQRLSTSEETPTATRAAGEALASMMIERNFNRLREFQTVSASFSEPWRAAAFTTTVLTYLTPDELDDLGEELASVLDRFRDRTIDRAKRPKSALPVQIVAFGHPLPPSESGN
jgi:DNA-binding transcriptional ArsR family regulator